MPLSLLLVAVLKTRSATRHWWARPGPAARAGRDEQYDCWLRVQGGASANSARARSKAFFRAPVDSQRGIASMSPNWSTGSDGGNS